MNIAVDDGRAFVRPFDTAYKVERVRNNPQVGIAISTVPYKLAGPAVRACATVLGDGESAYASRAIARKYPILHGFSVTLFHRLRCDKSVHIELAQVDST